MEVQTKTKKSFQMPHLFFLLLGLMVVLGTKSIDWLIDFCLYKLQDKGTTILIPSMFVLLVLLGAFGGSDALIAVIPIGVMFAKKLKLDPIVAAATTLLATLVGFSTSPTGIYIAQMLMDVPVYSGFGVRLLKSFGKMFSGLFFYAMKSKLTFLKHNPDKTAIFVLHNQDIRRNNHIAKRKGEKTMKKLIMAAIAAVSAGVVVFWLKKRK